MGIQIAYYTDKGTQKQTNEDSLVIRTASSSGGDIAMAAVCDGMGRGELASSTIVQALSEWFEEKLPTLIGEGYDYLTLKAGIEYEIRRQSKRIEDYAVRRGLRLGTTLTMILIVGGHLLTVNVGDSRVYEVGSSIVQLTKDHSLAQREVDRGTLRIEDMERYAHRNVLTQGIGDSTNLLPDVKEEPLSYNSAYLLCSDGFRHELSQEEIRSAIYAAVGKGDKNMKKTLEKLSQKAMSRGENDNITAVVISIS
jgi:serine/threonine protein phosphatase PrpC